MSLDDLRKALEEAAQTERIADWTGPTWKAMLTRHPYGLHFSVSAQGRLPTDAEVDAAFAGYRFGLWVEDHMQEVTAAHQKLGALNPYVRHFVPDEEAERYRRKAGL